jgi:hypothetical protein
MMGFCIILGATLVALGSIFFVGLSSYMNAYNLTIQRVAGEPSQSRLMFLFDMYVVILNNSVIQG